MRRRCFASATFPEFVTEQFTSPLSTAEAWAWLLRAAEAGSIQAQDHAAGNGAVVPVDLKAAAGMGHSRAGGGHAEAQFNLAAMLMEGEGCERDVVAAKAWLRRSLPQAIGTQNCSRISQSVSRPKDRARFANGTSERCSGYSARRRRRRVLTRPRPLGSPRGRHLATR